MDSDRIKEIQMGTAYPESVSVHQALLQVWNECEQSKSVTITDNESQGECECEFEWFECPECEECDIAEGSNYCPNCGAKINWELKN